MAEIDPERVRWLEVSLTLNYELAEAVAEVLSRYVSNGVVVETEMIYNDAEDRGTPSGLAKVFGYLPVDERLEENRQRLEEGLWYLGRIQELPEAQYKFIADPGLDAGLERPLSPDRDTDQKINHHAGLGE